MTCGQAQALLRWGLQKGMSVLPRSRHPPHIAQNLGARVVRFPPSSEHTCFIDLDLRAERVWQGGSAALSEAAVAQLDTLDEGRVTAWNPSAHA